MDFSREEILRAYTVMRTIRSFEERINSEFMEGRIPGFVHLYAGQEASAVGICMHLKDADFISSTHRGHGHCIAKGCDVNAMMLEIFGKADGLCRGKGGSMHIADLDRGMLGANGIVGGGSPLAIGAALSAKRSGRGNVAVAFIGDGGSNQGTTLEALNMAVVLQLPVVFVFENNGYGEGTGADYAVGSKDIAARAGAFGLPSCAIDGYDFFAVHAAAGEAVDRARRGLGPSAIETRCRRFYGHFVGDPELYRPAGEKNILRDEHDCLRLFRERSGACSGVKSAEFDSIDAEVDALIDAAVSVARAGAPPRPESLTTDVYVRY
jgi:pyruvate dehydrogenase E1 component alpha subunit